ncbi:hypothetical protein [Nocardioides sambongensis]|uniref:hypothetical protein n=1 Tax=Nocardioides sambongensis TaxID=2589074 RepID=UPI00112EED03|nr:hypothetical protein [Nocardioides sambongensis]
MRSISHAASTLARSPRLLMAAGLAAILLAVAVAMGMWTPTPVAAEDAASAEIDTVDALPATEPDDLRAPRDPLSIEEIGYAEALATDALPSGAETVDGGPGAELLSVDLASTDPETTTRPVEVTFYDYGAGGVVAVTVELYSGKVRGVVEAEGMQPAPSPSETFAATEILIASPEAQKLGTEYTAMTGHLITAEDLIVTGGSYYDTVESPRDDDCGEHRCVELQLQEPSGKYLSTTDYVVDLTTGEVIVLATRDLQSSLGGN